jgi:IS5 family transposase
MRELPSLLRTSAEQAGWTGAAAIDASSFQRDQTSSYYRNRANYSLQTMKTTILIDMNTLAIKDVHYTTRKSWDGYIRMQVLCFRRKTCKSSPQMQTTPGVTFVKSVETGQHGR